MPARDGSLNATECSVLRRPDWRWPLALRIANGLERSNRRTDLFVQFLVRYFHAMWGRCQRVRRSDRSKYEAIEAARSIWAENGPTRWELEARILARQTNEAIVDRVGYEIQVIDYFERAFFSVRDHLDTSFWIVDQAIRLSEVRLQGNRDLGPIWRQFAYFAGHHALDAAIEASKSSDYAFWPFVGPPNEAGNCRKFRHWIAVLLLPARTPLRLLIEIDASRRRTARLNLALGELKRRQEIDREPVTPTTTHTSVDALPPELARRRIA